MSAVDATRGPLAVAVGHRREDAARVFGPEFDDLLVTTYDDLRQDLADHRVEFLGIAAGDDMLGTLGEALARLGEDRALQIAVELPPDEALGRGVRDAILAAQVRVVSVQRFGELPCVGLMAGIDQPHGVDWLLTALTGAAGPGPEGRASRQDQVAVEWELAAARARADDLEDRLLETRAELASLRKERGTPGTRPSDGSPGRATGGRGGSGAATPDAAPLPRSFRSTLRRFARDLSGALGARGRRSRALTSAGLGAITLVLLVACPVALGLLGGATWVLSGVLLGLTLMTVVCVGLIAIRREARP